MINPQTLLLPPVSVGAIADAHQNHVDEESSCRNDVSNIQTHLKALRYAVKLAAENYGVENDDAENKLMVSPAANNIDHQSME